MFCDLVGSTALCAGMDPEDLREVISAYQKCLAETVRRFDGFLAKYLGDGVLAYFGYPQAHEDDAERAVRAGLEVIPAVARLKSPVCLQTRVGIATGVVVVGDLTGSGDAQERGIVGETPNLAARLQGIAETNMVVVADATRRLLGHLFDLQDLGPKDLKGIAGRPRAWAALRASSVASRFEALHTASLVPFVGREKESELLLQRWSAAKTGEGQVVLLSGEAGIGKSRLTAALLEHIAAEPHIRLRYFCSPQHTDSALYPIIGQMQRAAGLEHDDTAKARLDKLDAVLAQTSTAIEDAALFAEMLSLPNDGRYSALEMSPQQRRHRTLQELLLTLPESETRAARELPIQIALGLIYMATSGPASVDAAEAYARARDICEQINDKDHLMGVLIGLRHVNQVQGKSLAARSYGAQCLDVAQRKGDRIFSVQENANLAHTLCIMGSFADARSHLVEALAGYDPIDCLSHRAISGLDPQSFCLGIAGWNEWFLGYPDQALQAALQAVAVARSQGYPQSVDQALHCRRAHTLIAP
jgi:class 3 adenylate cyclase